jgi:hypothetical protein
VNYVLKALRDLHKQSRPHIFFSDNFWAHCTFQTWGTVKKVKKQKLFISTTMVITACIKYVYVCVYVCTCIYKLNFCQQQNINEVIMHPTLLWCFVALNLLQE